LEKYYHLTIACMDDQISIKAMRLKNLLTSFFVAVLLVTLVVPRQAIAMDKRLKLAIKTGGYGAAIGAVVGGATWVLGMGGVRDVFMGASSGMYAGVLLAAYIVSTQDETDQPHSRAKNPYAPRKPAGPHDWENEDQDDNEEPKPQSLNKVVPQNTVPIQLVQNIPAQKRAQVWAPLFSLSF
jgi:hypothetical protein